jgi:hypothetical protein
MPVTTAKDKGFECALKALLTKAYGVHCAQPELRLPAPRLRLIEIVQNSLHFAFAFDYL